MWMSGTAQAPTAMAHRCPHCRWQAGPADEWLCNRCGWVWNTFSTHGICPGCEYHWMETQCLSCGEWSAHQAWYMIPQVVH